MDKHYIVLCTFPGQLRSIEEELCKRGPPDVDSEAEATVSAIRLMLASDSDVRGTVASMAHAMDTEFADGKLQAVHRIRSN